MNTVASGNTIYVDTVNPIEIAAAKEFNHCTMTWHCLYSWLYGIFNSLGRVFKLILINNQRAILHCFAYIKSWIYVLVAHGNVYSPYHVCQLLYYNSWNYHQLGFLGWFVWRYLARLLATVSWWWQLVLFVYSLALADSIFSCVSAVNAFTCRRAYWSVRAVLRVRDIRLKNIVLVYYYIVTGKWTDIPQVKVTGLFSVTDFNFWEIYYLHGEFKLFLINAK